MTAPGSGEQITAELAEALDNTATGLWMAQAGPGWGRNVAAVLLPVVEAYATRKAAEAEAKVLDAVQAVYDLQCPVMPPDQYVGAGAHIAHLWWQKVLGGRLRDLRARADALTATHADHGKATT